MLIGQREDVVPRKHPVAHASNGGQSAVWALDSLPSHIADELEQWLEKLAALTLDEWRSIGRQCMVDDAASTARSEPMPSIHAVALRRELGATAWFVLDLVETATHRVRGDAARTSRAAERELARAVAAAEAAALAIAARERLPTPVYQTLRAPFDGIDERGELRLA
jgi:hypothetical protein